MKSLLLMLMFVFGLCFVQNVFVKSTSVLSMNPGSLNLIAINNNSIKLDYTESPAVLYLNGKVVWKGDGKSIKVEDSDGKLIIKVDGKQVWPN